MEAERILDQADDYATLVAQSPPPCTPLCPAHPCSALCSKYAEARNPSVSWGDYTERQERWDREVLTPYLKRWES